ncbi:MAG TPA: SRPBCC domain-containing protein [Terriglobia bacterium]|nr:SRPBCC domain-containing protein [Terriglobia bacterium]
MCKTIKHKVRFKIPPDTVYDLLADSRKRTEVTGSEALISNKVGGEFSTEAGQVTGVNVDLARGRRLVQAWRRNDFPEGIYSMAAITLAPTPGGGTELVLTHRGVPKHLLDQIEDYWRRVYWAPMKERR